MAGSSLLTLIDDIATLLDDVATMTKIAVKKTSGVLGDDLALNAQQVAGVHADRELPVVWAVARGSAVNKAILVPAALAISALAPWAIVPLLMLGGAFLCYEGFEKVAHKLLHRQADDEAHQAELRKAVGDPTVDMVAFEKDKIKGAVRTDFVLSAEIIVITLGTVATASFGKQIAVLSGIGVIMTIGVYGLVAGIVKLDDAGLHLSSKSGTGSSVRLQQKLGRGLLLAAPYFMKLLGIAGTIAMFMVGGGILRHGIPALHHGIERITQEMATVAGIGGVLELVAPPVLNALAGVVAGGLAVVAVAAVARLYRAVTTRS